MGGWVVFPFGACSVRFLESCSTGKPSGHQNEAPLAQLVAEALPGVEAGLRSRLALGFTSLTPLGLYKNRNVKASKEHGACDRVFINQTKQCMFQEFIHFGKTVLVANIGFIGGESPTKLRFRLVCLCLSKCVSQPGQHLAKWSPIRSNSKVNQSVSSSCLDVFKRRLNHPTLLSGASRKMMHLPNGHHVGPEGICLEGAEEPPGVLQTHGSSN